MWGVNTFDNNDAIEWLKNIEANNDFKSVNNLIKSLNGLSDLDDVVLKECTEALAAIELVASAKTDNFKTFPADKVDWLTKSEYSFSETEIKAAAQLAKSIKKDSEIRELFLDSPLLKSWEEYMDDLIKKLK